MSEPVIPASPLKFGIAVAKWALPDWSVASKIPATRPDRFVRVSLLNQEDAWAMSKPRLLFEVFATKVADADSGSARLWGHISAAGARQFGDVWVNWGRPSSLVDLPNPDVTTHERWQLIGDFGLS